MFLASTLSLGVLLGACSSGADPAPQSPAPQPPAQQATSANGVAGTPPPSGGQKTPEPVMLPRAELDADDQRGNGTQLLLEETELPVAGQVAVHDQAGNLLGSAPVQAGEHRGSTVTLAPTLGKGTHLLYAVLTVDDGDGKFDPTRDAPVRDDDNELESERLLYTVG